jgi:hypothetical protein
MQARFDKLSAKHPARQALRLLYVHVTFTSALTGFIPRVFTFPPRFTSREHLATFKRVEFGTSGWAAFLATVLVIAARVEFSV